MNIEELEKKYEALGEEIERLKAEAVDSDDEWPKVWDEFFIVAEDWAIDRKVFAGTPRDRFNQAIGNIHRTEKEAEAYRAYRTNPRTVMRDKIQMFVDEYNGDMRGKFTISCGGNVIRDAGLLNSVAIKDACGANLLLEKFGLPNILWACGGSEPGGEKQ